MEKNVRLRIASRYPNALPYGGLTTREHAARKRYDALPPETKAMLALEGKKRLLAMRGQAAHATA